MPELVPVVWIDPVSLPDDDLVVRAAAIAAYRYQCLAEHSDAAFRKTGWWDHEQELREEAESRGIGHEVDVAGMMGHQEWRAQRLALRRELKRQQMADHLVEHPMDDPYRRPYPHSSWCSFDGAWHALVAEGLGVFHRDECGNKVFASEEHLEGCHLPGHPYYQLRRDLIDYVRSLPGHRPR